MPSLRKIYQKFFIRVLGRFRKKNIIFYCSSSFHIPHIEKVISKLSAEGAYNTFLVCPTPFDIEPSLSTKLVNSNLNDFPKHIIIDLLVSSEAMSLPYYFCGTSVYFGHGIGPKMNYQLNSRIHEYNYIFSPCKFFFDEFCKILPKARVVPVGLPILDDVHKTPTGNLILYAPSWCNDRSYISDIQAILNLLGRLNNYRIIVSLHPNLLRDSLVSIEDIRSQNGAIELLHETEFRSSFDALKFSSLVIGEISSILFEGLAFDIPIVFDGNSEIYEYCESTSVLEKAQQCFYQLSDITTNSQVDEIVTQDSKKVHRETFASDYLLNQGQATDTFIDALKVLT